MLKSINRTNKIERCLALLLGISVSEGISSVFTVGSTSFTMSEVFAPIVLVWLLVHNTRGLASFAHNIPIGYKMLFLVIILSIIPGMIYFMSTKILYRYLVGIIYLLIILTMAIDAFLLREQKDDIIKGLLVGFIANIIFVLVCFTAFKHGSVITLRYFIQRDGFYAPILSFRSQGFFLEPSHFIRYVGTVVFVIMSMSKVKVSIIK